MWLSRCLHQRKLLSHWTDVSKSSWTRHFLSYCEWSAKKSSPMLLLHNIKKSEALCRPLDYYCLGTLLFLLDYFGHWIIIGCLWTTHRKHDFRYRNDIPLICTELSYHFLNFVLQAWSETSPISSSRRYLSSQVGRRRTASEDTASGESCQQVLETQVHEEQQPLSQTQNWRTRSN